MHPVLGHQIPTGLPAGLETLRLVYAESIEQRDLGHSCRRKEAQRSTGEMAL